MKFAERFEKRFREILKEDFEKLIKCLNFYPKICVRVNTLKISRNELKEIFKEYGIKIEKVPWYKNAFFVDEPEIGKFLEHMLGYYYVQDGSSLVPVKVLDVKEGEKVLDLCAAPGSKTTQIAMEMKNTGSIIANDIDLKRVKALRFNLQRCGVTNTLVTIKDGKKFWKLGLKFDKILVDVPCSATGKIFGKEGLHVIKSWREWQVKKLFKLQLKLLESAVKCLKENGKIVYSTCSLDVFENEFVVNKIAEKYGLKICKIKVKGLKYKKGFKSFGKFEFLKSMKNAIRIYPWQNGTEGFFICKLSF